MFVLFFSLPPFYSILYPPFKVGMRRGEINPFPPIFILCGAFSLWGRLRVPVCVWTWACTSSVLRWNCGSYASRSRSCYSGREWRQLCLQLKSWHTFTRIYYSYHSVSGRDLRPPVYLTNSPFCELSVPSKLCSHWWIEFLWALLTHILTEGQGQ